MRTCLIRLAVVAAVAMVLESFALSQADRGYRAFAAEPSLFVSDAGLAPVAVERLPGGRLGILGSSGRRLLIVDCVSGELVRSIPLPAEGSGMAVRGSTAYVTTNEPAGRLLAIDWQQGVLNRQWRVGHMPMAPVLSDDGRTIFLANRFENRVRSIDLTTGTQRTTDVIREPVALALGPHGDRLFVANHLPHVRPFLDDENPVIVAEISVVDTKRMRVIASIELPNGSQSLRGLALSPDGRFVVVTHVMSNYIVPTMEIAGGAINRNALSLVSTDDLELCATVILDDPDCGAANPWGVCFSSEGHSLVVAHAGTHELSVIDYAALLKRMEVRDNSDAYFDAESLNWMAGIRQRVHLPLVGPRAICAADSVVCAAGYFSDNIAAVDLRSTPPTVREIDLGGRAEPSLARRGEQAFNDAALCFQKWQSCATCHPDGRADALYWDLLNDGVGNTKNTKSLLTAALTPPVMWRGVRADAGMAVVSGIRHIQFAHTVAPTSRSDRAVSGGDEGDT